MGISGQWGGKILNSKGHFCSRGTDGLVLMCAYARLGKNKGLDHVHFSYCSIQCSQIFSHLLGCYLFKRYDLG
uniref:Uncharacterized protein n=1 Tax=Anguilla anguilla TaxID=7936 RepID=A0A0E9VMB9_ANGAN